MTVSGSWGVGASAGGWGRRLSGAPRDIDPPTGRAIMVRTVISAGGGRRRHKVVYKLASGGRWSFVRTLAVPARLRTGSAEPPRCGRCGWAFTSRLMREQRPGNTAVRRHLGRPRQHQFGRTRSLACVGHARGAQTRFLTDQDATLKKGLKVPSCRHFFSNQEATCTMETAPPTQRGDQAGRDTPLSPHRPGARGGPGPTEDINRGVSTSTSPPLSVERTQKELEGGEGETESTAAQMQAQTAAGRRAETVGKEGGRRGGRRGEGGGDGRGGRGRSRGAPAPRHRHCSRGGLQLAAHARFARFDAGWRLRCSTAPWAHSR